MKKLTAACGLLIALTACSNPPMPVAPNMGSTLPKTSMDVQVISLADRTGAQPAGSPYASNHFTPTFSDAIKQWATDRLQAVGHSGRAIILIKDASLTSQALPMQTGFESWFKRQQSLKYIGHAEVTIEANGNPGYAITDASATRSVTLPENATAVEKQEAYYTLLNGLMKDLGQNLDAGIQSHLSKFIITAPILGTTAVPVVTTSPATDVQSADPAPVYGDAPVSPTGPSSAP